MDEYTTFGDRLKEEREKRNITQEVIAEMLGTTKQVISNYEMSKRYPKVTVVKDFAKKLGVDMHYLIDPNYTQQNSRTPGKIPYAGAFGQIHDPGIHNVKFLNDLYDCNADFCLQASDASMQGSGIGTNDIVFIKSGSHVTDGDIAAVSLDEKIILRRIYRTKDRLILQSDANG